MACGCLSGCENCHIRKSSLEKWLYHLLKKRNAEEYFVKFVGVLPLIKFCFVLSLCSFLSPFAFLGLFFNTPRGGLRRKLIWLPPHLSSVFNLFSDTLHYAQTADLAVQVVKGIQHFPLNTDRLEGTIDIWWIMNILAEFKLEKRHNRGLEGSWMLAVLMR